MAQTKEFFLTVTQRIFSNWTALKMAVEYGMGEKERALEFCSYITEVMYMNENLNSSEVACELEDFMDEHFNTQLEDNSGTQVADELLRFYQYCTENNEATAIAELEKLPALQPWILSTEPVRRAQHTREREEESSNSENEESKTNMEPADEEWTEVRTRRKR